MNKNNVISLILLDIIVMGISLALIIFRYTTLTKLDAGQHEPNALMYQETFENPELEALKKELGTATAVQQADHQNVRNIRFTFRHSAAQKVELIADFNDWIPESFTKGKKHTWYIDKKIAPGEYAYNFVIDGRPIKDPNNQNVCNVGRGFTNSLLKVKPLPHER